MKTRRQKTEEANVLIGHKGVYYYRKGDHERSLETTNFKEAVRRKRAYEAKMDVFGLQAFTLRVSDVITDFLEERWREVETGEIRESTYRETERMFKVHLCDFFGPVKFADISEPLWDEYCSKKSGDLSNHRKIFGYFLSWAKRKQFYRYTPDLTIPRAKRRLRKILSPDICTTLLKNSSGSLRLFIGFYLFMGMRRSEIIRMEWSRIDLDQRFLTLFASDTKTNRPRQIPINAFCLDLLKQRYMNQRIESLRPRWVFPNASDSSRHASASGLKTAWQTCLRKSGLSGEGLQWHDLRATHQYYAHKRLDFTDAQKEKFSGSSVDVQKRTYISFNADDVRGLESVVTFEGLDDVLDQALREEHGKNTGKDFRLMAKESPK